MSDLFNPIGRALPGLTGPTVVSGVVSNPPRSLIDLNPGTILKGTILGRGSDGLVAVATDKGTVKVATTAQLPTGSHVTLEVRNAGDRLQVLILAVETQGQRNSPQANAGTQSASASGGNAAGSATGSAAGAAQIGGTAKDAPAQPAPRPTSQPPIEVVGSSVKAIVVQAPATGSLLPAPVADLEPFLPPLTPTPVPADAVQKAQVVAQAQQLFEASIAELDAAAAGPEPVPGTLGTSPGQAAGAKAPMINIAAPGIPPVQQPAQPAMAGALQPEVAQRIAALFAAADQGAMKPALATPGATAGATQAALSVLLAGNLAATGAATATPVRMLVAGTELTLHVIAVLPEKGGELEIAPDASKLAGASAPLLGRVLGYTRAGHPVIETPAGLMMMQQKTRLPVGAQVALVLEPLSPTVPNVIPAITTPQQALLSLSSGWPTLDDLVAVLRGSASPASAAGAPPPPGIPQTGSRLAAGLANAMAALVGGDIERLLGPLFGTRKPSDGKDEVVKRLKDEFTQLAELAKDRPGIDWRALYLPIYDQRVGLTQINLYYRSGGGDDADEAERKERGTRFVVEVNFAALGAFQLDGLIRNKRFDLMIRSRRGLSPSQRRDIIGIFEQALELGGCKGGLEFRKVESFPVSPLDDLRQSHDQFTA